MFKHSAEPKEPFQQPRLDPDKHIYRSIAVPLYEQLAAASRKQDLIKLAMQRGLPFEGKTTSELERLLEEGES